MVTRSKIFNKFSKYIISGIKRWYKYLNVKKLKSCRNMCDIWWNIQLRRETTLQCFLKTTLHAHKHVEIFFMAVLTEYIT